MGLRRQLAGEGFDFVQRVDQFRLGERINGQRGQFVVGGAKGGNLGLNRVRTHDSNICSNSKKLRTYF